MLHFVTMSARPGSALVGGWLENFECAEVAEGHNSLEPRNTLRGSAFFSCWGFGVLIYISTQRRVVISDAS